MVHLQSYRREKWPECSRRFFCSIRGTAGTLFLLDRLEFCVVDLFSGDEQVEPRVESFQMRILRYRRVNIFHVGGVFETGYLNPEIFVMGHADGWWKAH